MVAVVGRFSIKPTSDWKPLAISVTAKRGPGPRNARSTQRWEGEYFRPPNVVGNERRLRGGLALGRLVWRSLSKCSQAARDAQG